MELYLYAKRQIENVKACPGTWKVDMMKFEECENLSTSRLSKRFAFTTTAEAATQPDYFSKTDRGVNKLTASLLLLGSIFLISGRFERVQQKRVFGVYVQAYQVLRLTFEALYKSRSA